MQILNTIAVPYGCTEFDGNSNFNCIFSIMNLLFASTANANCLAIGNFVQFLCVCVSKRFKWLKLLYTYDYRAEGKKKATNIPYRISQKLIYFVIILFGNGVLPAMKQKQWQIGLVLEYLCNLTLTKWTKYGWNGRMEESYSIGVCDCVDYNEISKSWPFLFRSNVTRSTDPFHLVTGT